MKFTKAAATGNDFILIDNRNKILSGSEQNFFRDICRRRYSVGADGIILLEDSSCADILYRHFNSDGRPAEMCGNGARCISLYACKKHLTGENLSFEINGIIYHAVCRKKSVTVTFPYPKIINLDKRIFLQPGLQEAGFIETGVPHFVVFSGDLDDLNVEKEGIRYRSHPEFRHGTNVDFVEITADRSIKIRTFERGVESETMACGTGAVASAIIAHLREGLSPPILVITKGGHLKIDWNQQKQTVSLTGPAELIYEGELIQS
jgi:diaminopimelate epimerase